MVEGGIEHTFLNFRALDVKTTQEVIPAITQKI